MIKGAHGVFKRELGPTIKKLDDDYHKTIEHYKAIAQKRKMLLQQK